MNGHSIFQTEENIAKSGVSIGLNHYYLQSKEYWTDIKMKRDCLNINRDMFINHTLEEFNDNNTRLNEVFDNHLYCKHKTWFDSI